MNTALGGARLDQVIPLHMTGSASPFSLVYAFFFWRKPDFESHNPSSPTQEDVSSWRTPS